jgi:tripartite ATP-independent transporter DctP family solute receptor
MKTRSILTLAIAAALATGAAHAQFQDRTLRMANASPKDHPMTAGGNKMAECTLAKSGGKLKVQVFADGVLGSDLQAVAAVRTGTIDFTNSSTSPIAGAVPELGVLDLPFLFNNAKEADAVLDGKVGDWLAAKMPAIGMIHLAYYENGFRHSTNSKRPITKLEDFSGIKMRVMQNKVYIDTFNALGTNAVPMAFTEVYSGLETKAVDGQENPYLNIQNMKFYEVQKYLSLTNHSYSANMMIFSKKIWDTLSPQEQGVLKACAIEGRDFERKLNREKEDASLAFLKAQGMVVNEISAPEMARIREKTKPIYDNASKTIGAEAMNMMFDELKRIRGQ